VALLIKRQGIL